jgi:hypothetical protein
MSCWVVPAIAAEFWGVTLDVVWDRIYSDLVPHKTEQGFVFIDVDPWGPTVEGAGHVPPPTFVMSPEPTEHGSFSISLDPAESRMLRGDLPTLRGASIYPEEIMLVTGTALDENDEPVRDSFRELDSSSFERDNPDSADLESAELEQLRNERGSATAVALRNGESDDESSGGEELDADEVDSADAELPELDEEESATFARLSWRDVRKSVGRTRKPPSKS